MNAREMFEELGFKLTSDSLGDMVCSRNRKANGSCDPAHYFYEITFDLTFKTHDFRAWFMLNNRKQSNFFEVNIKLHQAITQQVKELGWIE